MFPFDDVIMFREDKINTMTTDKSSEVMVSTLYGQGFLYEEGFQLYVPRQCREYANILYVSSKQFRASMVNACVQVPIECTCARNIGCIQIMRVSLIP